jgi:hypothetical protein
MPFPMQPGIVYMLMISLAIESINGTQLQMLAALMAWASAR